MSSSGESQPQLPSEPPWPKETGIWATYSLHCHCGAVRYTMSMSPPLFHSQAEGKGIWTVSECNCSWCERNGLQTVHPLAENVTWTRGEGELSRYQMGAKNVTHLFCRRCGSVVGSDAREMFRKGVKPERMAINVSVHFGVRGRRGRLTKLGAGADAEGL